MSGSDRSRQPGWARRRQAALAGHEDDPVTARGLLADDDPGVRGTALGALARLGVVTDAEVRAAVADADPTVRVRAAEVVAATGSGVPLAPLLADPDPSVVEVAAWASGERQPEEPGVVEVLAQLTIGHDDALVREAAVAALGALGDEQGLAAILAATHDRATVRRRAVLALAPFEGPEVTTALERARTDRDWQVRQAAEDLLA